MNVLVALSKTDDQINNVINGYAFALNACGVNIIQWGGGAPLFEVLDRYKPSLMIISPDTINKTMIKAHKEFQPETWMLFRFKDELKNKLDGAKEIGVISEEEVGEGQYFEPFGADIVNYGPHRKDKKYEIKYSYVGRYSSEIEKLYSTLKPARIYSSDVWNCPAYVGVDNNKPAIFASSEYITTPVIPEQDTDFYNILYSGVRFFEDDPVLTGAHSYFHRIFSLVTKLGGHDDLKLKLEQKMKEVEGLYEKNRTGTE